MKTRFTQIIGLIALSAAFTAASFAQTQQQQPPAGPPPGSTPMPITDAENASLASSYKDGKILQQNTALIQADIDKQTILLNQAKREQAEWLGVFKGELEDVKKSHGWGKDVTFDPNTLSFVKLPASALPAGTVPTPTPAAAAKPAAKPEAKPEAKPATPPASK